jgi:hypothetical protein
MARFPALLDGAPLLMSCFTFKRFNRNSEYIKSKRVVQNFNHVLVLESCVALFRGWLIGSSLEFIQKLISSCLTLTMRI